MSNVNWSKGWGILPAALKYSKEVSSDAKILFTEVFSLAQQTGVCWASNEFFAERFGVTDRAIRKWLSQLSDAGFIEFLTRGEDGGSRKIRVCEARFFESERSANGGGGAADIPKMGEERTFQGGRNERSRGGGTNVPGGEERTFRHSNIIEYDKRVNTVVVENAQARKIPLPSESETSDLREEIPPSPPSSAAPPASPANGGWRPFDMAAEAELMKNDHRVEYLFARDCKVKKPDVPALLSEALTEFLLKQEAIAHTYNNATEFRKHFFLWAALVVVDGKIVYPSSSRSPQPAYGQPAPPPSKVVFGKPSYPNVPAKVTFR